MFKKTSVLTIGFAVLLWVGFGFIPNASAAVPPTITQQGRLLDAASNGIDGDISFVFTIYDAATAGNNLWTKTQTITLDKGYFSIKLGDAPAFPATVFDGSKTLFLGIKVGQDAELAPRQEITSVPYALHAGEADHAAAATTATSATSATNAAHVAWTGITGFPAACTAPQFLTGFDAAGTPVCASPQSLSCVTRYDSATSTSAGVNCAAGEVITGGGCFAAGLTGSHPYYCTGLCLACSVAFPCFDWYCNAAASTSIGVYARCCKLQ